MKMLLNIATIAAMAMAIGGMIAGAIGGPAAAQPQPSSSQFPPPPGAPRPQGQPGPGNGGMPMPPPPRPMPPPEPGRRPPLPNAPGQPPLPQPMTQSPMPMPTREPDGMVPLMAEPPAEARAAAEAMQSAARGEYPVSATAAPPAPPVVAAPPSLPVASAAARPAPETIATPAASAAPWFGWGVVALVLLLLSGWWVARRRGRLLAEEAEQLSRQQVRLTVEHQRLKAQSERLREQSIQDPLTGVLNRAAFAGEFRELAERAAAGDRLLNLVVFDLDHFKTINDRQGHLAGDAALKLVVGIVREHLVSADLFGRFGGDEFLIACADQPLPFCRDLAERIRIAVETRASEHRPPLTGLSLSMGIAQADAETGYVADALFARADAALYAAKRQGRNRVVVADVSLPQADVTAQRHL
ncbi:MAG: GGDEF domain-containing protein [Pseudomonadota bacterium]